MAAAAPLRARGLTVVRGPATVLESVDLLVSAGQRIGVVGPNGVGKSTLLQALAGSVPLERGAVERTPPTATVGYLPQEPSRSDVETVAVYLARRTGVAAATAEMEAATIALAARADGAADRYAVALDHWLSLGAADLDARVGQVWAELGLASQLLEQPTASLSGGEAARAGLAALLLARFDVFLLDEPTNDLDLDGLDRLERWVTELRAPVVLVSHDRTFLARTVTDVVELDEFTHRAARYGGGWQAYLDERGEGAASGVGALRRVRHATSLARPAGPAGAGVGRPGPVEGALVRRAGQEHPRLQDQPDRAARRPGGAHGTGDGAAGGRRQAPGAVAAAPGGLLAGPQRRRRRPPRRRRRPRGGRSSSARSTCSSGRASASPSSVPTDPARRRCSTPCSGAPSSPPDGAHSVRAWWSARSSRRATASPARRRCCGRSRTPPAWMPATCAHCSPSSASSPTT